MLDAHVKIQCQSRGVVLLAARVGAFEVLGQLLLRPPLLGLLLLLELGLVVRHGAFLREALIPLENLNFYLYFVVLPEAVLQPLILQLQELAPLREILYFSQKLAFLSLLEGGRAFRVGKVVFLALGG